MSENQVWIVRAAIGVLLPTYILLLPWMWTPFPFNIQWGDLIFVLMLVCLLFVREFCWLPRTGLDWLVLAYVIGECLSLVDVSSLGTVAVALSKLGYLLMLYLTFGSLAQDDVIRRTIAIWLARGAVVVAGIGVAVFLLGMFKPFPQTSLSITMLVPYLGQVDRLTVGFPTPELLGNFLTMSLPFVAGLLLVDRGGERTPWHMIGVGLVILAEILTFSHSWVGFLVAGIIFCWNMWQGAAWKWIRGGLVTGAIALFIVVNVASVFYVKEVSITAGKVPVSDTMIPTHVPLDDEWPHVQLEATYNYLYYFLLKMVAWETFLEHPVNGIGVDNFHAATEKAVLEGRLQAFCRQCDPHSTLFGELAEGGVLAGLPLLVLWVGVFVVGRRLLRSAPDRERLWVVRAALAGSVGVFVNGLNVDIMHFRFLWIGWALLRGCARRFS